MPLLDRGQPGQLGRLVPWTVWTVATVAALAYVARFGVPIPFSDEWANVPQTVGDLPITAEWLWDSLAGHVMPLSRLIYVGVIRLGGLDFRAGMFAGVALLSLSAGLLLIAAAGLRGGPRWTDAFLPLAVLSLAQHENLLWSIQLLFVVSVTLAYALALAIVRWRPTSRAPGRLAAAALLCLPLLDPAGVLLAAPLIAWLLWALWRQGRGALPDPVAIVVALAALAIVPVVVEKNALTDGLSMFELGAAPQRAVEVLSTALGTAAAGHQQAAAGMALALSTLAVVQLAHCCRAPERRVTAVGLLALLGASLLLVAGVAYKARTLGSWWTLRSGYVTLATPVLIFCYLAFAAGHRRLVSRVGSVVLLAVTLAALPSNIENALEFGRIRSGRYATLVADLRAGLPLEALVGRHGFTVADDDFRDVGRYLETLEAHRLGPFRDPAVRLRRENRRLVEREVPLLPVQVHEIDLAGGLSDSDDPYVTFALPEPIDVVGVVLEFRLLTPRWEPWLQVWWADSTDPRRNAFTPWERHTQFWGLSRPEPQSYRVWVYDRIDRVRIDPDAGPCRFVPLRLAVLVAEEPGD